MLHAFAFSSRVDGIGVASGAPYGCNLLPGDSCGHDAPTGAWANELARFRKYIAARYARGAIDNPSNLTGTPAFLFRGTLDRLVALPVMQVCEQIAQTAPLRSCPHCCTRHLGRQAVASQLLEFGANVVSEFSVGSGFVP